MSRPAPTVSPAMNNQIEEIQVQVDEHRGPGGQEGANQAQRPTRHDQPAEARHTARVHTTRRAAAPAADARVAPIARRIAISRERAAARREQLVMLLHATMRTVPVTMRSNANAVQIRPGDGR